MTVTLEATTASGTKETKTLENVKNYTISTATQLNKLADVVNGGNNLQNETIVQLADIDVNPGKWTENEDGTTNFQNDATKWQVIGSATYDYDSNSHSNIKSFAGTFNGKQNKIAGVYINNSSRDEVGLFSINEGIIENVILKNSSIKGRYNAGGIASGNSSQAEIRNCTNYASVSGTRCVGGICGWSRETLDNDINYGQISSDSRTGWKLVYETVGGIVGWGDNTITNCKNYGNVSSLTSQRNHEINGVGGIIGGASFGDISNCYNEGNISCIGLDAGGIVGAVPIAERNVIISRCYNNGDITGRVAAGISGWGYYMQIQDCYNRGNIQGSYQSAGITGWTGKNGAIINSYNIGEVTGNGIKWVGGILGRYYDTPTLTNCYHLNTSSANGIGDDNNGWASTTENDWDEHIEVKTDEEMRKLASQLGDNWTEDTSNINNGYPILKWQVE